MQKKKDNNFSWFNGLNWFNKTGLSQWSIIQLNSLMRFIPPGFMHLLQPIASGNCNISIQKLNYPDKDKF